MKQFLMVCLVIMAFLVPGGTYGFAKAHEVNGPMPTEWKDLTVCRVSQWCNETICGSVHRYCEGEDVKFSAAFCPNNQERPFGVFDFEAMKLYLDNKPMDGMIDEIITENFPYVRDTVPGECWSP